ncbi:hypothetical protein DERP_005862, partial [Dermatophagoides pteronyssinus]
MLIQTKPRKKYAGIHNSQNRIDNFNGNKSITTYVFGFIISNLLV